VQPWVLQWEESESYPSLITDEHMSKYRKPVLTGLGVVSGGTLLALYGYIGARAKVSGHLCMDEKVDERLMMADLLQDIVSFSETDVCVMANGR